MHRSCRFRVRPLTLLLASILTAPTWAADSTATEEEETLIVRQTAEQELKQQPGVSIITAEDIAKNPPVNDISDIIRKMPGVNLTGNSANGSRGNNRQIDIRGMGPENTLILIDGVPVGSRSAVRYSWKGERDTRGDSNWVPAELVERIEVLRGPAAARYGSGAAGGVVNIITKRPTKDWHGSLSLFTNQPENSKEGDTKRANFDLSGPLAGDVLTMRLYGNINKTDADAIDINRAENGSYAAGREGVRNKDINALLSWKLTPTQIVDFNYGYSRQGSIYAGDTTYSNSQLSPGGLVDTLYGQETNRMYRQNYGLTHNGFWEWGDSKVGVYYEKTNNTRLKEGSTGRVEGMINSDEYATSRLENYRTSGEVTLPFDRWVEHTVTLGAEWNREQLNDPASMTATNVDSVTIGGVSGNASQRSTENSAETAALYFEDNIQPLEGTALIPGLRFDHHSKFGSNWSPSLNLSQALGDYFKVKAGIARVFKAPNLYQSSEGYLLTTRGNGCPVSIGGDFGCYLTGNADLDAEVSVNKELGLEFAADGYAASLTWFRNDYKNKIIAGDNLIATASDRLNVLRWENGGKALVEGLEASLAVPLVRDVLDWRTNATYMMESKNKETGNPLSVIPKYTINSMLDYQVTDKFSTSVNWTLYGRQKPRQNVETRLEGQSPMSTTEVGAYSVVGVNMNYKLTKDLSVKGGVSNLFDKQLYRANDGASTYNEPGRAYYAGVTMSF